MQCGTPSGEHFAVPSQPQTNACLVFFTQQRKLLFAKQSGRSSLQCFSGNGLTSDLEDSSMHHSCLMALKRGALKSWLPIVQLQ